MSSRVREVEHTSASQCEYETKTSYVTKSGDGGTWQEPAEPPTEAAAATAASVPTVVLKEGTTIRVAPMDRKCGGWDDEHFHDRLRLPEGCNAGRGLVVTFEGMASFQKYMCHVRYRCSILILRATVRTLLYHTVTRYDMYIHTCNQQLTILPRRFFSPSMYR